MESCDSLTWPDVTAIAISAAFMFGMLWILFRKS